MNHIVLRLVSGVLFCASSLWAVDNGGVTLVPEPKEVHLREGGFHVTPKTRIFVQLGHQSEDRIAAETLAEEISDQAGLRLDIISMKPNGKAEEGTIVLARLQDSRVRRFLAKNGLSADDVGDDGYLLFADKTHLIVAADSGEGLFYGVQTLRQLLRVEGKTVMCPSLTIRDWTNARPRLRNNISRGTVPEMPQFRSF